MQNQLVSLHRSGDSSDAATVLTELVALGRKNASTICESFIPVVDDLLNAGTPQQPLLTAHHRLLHVVIGDAIATNDLAFRMLFHRMRVVAAERQTCPHYCIVVVKCASHQSNLAVRSAILGPNVTNANSNPIIATCVRAFRYVFNDYGEEFAVNLATIVKDKCTILGPDTPEAVLEAARLAHREAMSLRDLYGESVLPEALLQLLSGRPSAMEHISGDGPHVDADHVQHLIFRRLQELCLQVHKKPIMSRFFVFGVCVTTLLRIHLLDLPLATLLQTGTVKPRWHLGISAVCVKAWGAPVGFWASGLRGLCEG